VGSSLNQRSAEFSLCNTLVLLLDLAFKQHDRNLSSSALPWLKDRKVIGMVDEDLPEEPHRQQSVEVRCTGILLGADEGSVL
jgi:hypothetical protein